MRVPQVIFKEDNVGSTPPQSGIYNRIAILSTFDRGPANTPSFISDYDDFSRRYGSNNAIGSMAYQVAYDQGAREFALVRVLGREKIAQGAVTFSGQSTVDNQTVKVKLGLIADAIDRSTIPGEAYVETNGGSPYTGGQTGRYWVRVLNPTVGQATVTVKYVLLLDSATSLYTDEDIAAGIPVNSVWAGTNPVVTTTSLTVSSANNIIFNGTVIMNSTSYALSFNGTSGNTPTIVNPVKIRNTANTGNYFVIVETITPSSTVANTAGLEYVFISDTNGSKFYTDNDLINGVPLDNVWDGTNPEPDSPLKVTLPAALDLDAGHGTYIPLQNGVEISFGVPGDTDLIPVKNGDLYSIRVREYNYSFSVNRYDLPNQVVTQAIAGLAGKEPIGKVEINESGDGIVFYLDPSPEYTLGGSAGNRWHYTFDVTDVTGLSVDSGLTTRFFTGGVDGPRNAYRDFYSTDGTPILRLIALSEGQWGNQLRASIYAIDNKKFRLTLEDLNGDEFNPVLTSEGYIISSDNIDEDGFYTDLSNSKFVRGIFLPKAVDPINYDASTLVKSPARTAPANTNITNPRNPAYPGNQGPSYLLDISLENGYDGPSIEESDYIEALSSIESLPVHIVCCPGQYDSISLKVAMIAHAENAEELEGLRIAVLNADPKVTPDWAFRETQGLDSRRAVMVAGWVTYSRQNKVARFSLSPDAVYAGKLAAIPVQVGPNARRTAGAVIGITETTMSRYSSRSSLQLMTDARIEVLAVDQATQSFNFTNGVTLSTDTTWEKVYFRRVYDMIRMDLYRALQIYKSETHTALLRREIESAINAYMTEKVRRGEIAAVGNVRADSTNNTVTTYLNYELYVSVEFLPLYSADYIVVSLIRNSQTGQVLFGV